MTRVQCGELRADAKAVLTGGEPERAGAEKDFMISRAAADAACRKYLTGDESDEKNTGMDAGPVDTVTVCPLSGESR